MVWLTCVDDSELSTQTAGGVVAGGVAPDEAVVDEHVVDEDVAIEHVADEHVADEHVAGEVVADEVAAAEDSGYSSRTDPSSSSAMSQSEIGTMDGNASIAQRDDYTHGDEDSGAGYAREHSQSSASQ